MSEPSAVPGPAPLPLIGWVGNAIQNAMQPLQRGLASQQRYGNLCGVVAGSQRFVLAFGATHNRAVLTQPDIFYTNDAATLPIKLPQKTALWRNWDNGLLQMNGARHDRQRRLMMPAMHKKRLDGYRDDIIHLTERQMQSWTPGSTRRMLDEMRELTMAVAIKILLGLDPEHEGKIMRAVVEQFTGLIQSPATMAMPINLPGTPFRRLIRVSEQWENEAKAMIARKRASGIDGGDVDAGA